MRIANTLFPTTMIGSLPHQSAEEAMQLLRRHPLAIPTWPQLPRRSFNEDMCVQYSSYLPGLQIDSKEKKIWAQLDKLTPEQYADFYEKALGDTADPFVLPRTHAEGWYAFLDDLSARKEKLPLIKGQVAGAITTGLSIADQTGRPVWFEPQYRDMIIRNMARTAAWMAQTLSRFAEKTIIFFDEPIFAALGSPAFIGISDDEVLDCYGDMPLQELHAAGGLAGIHCCGNTDWPILMRTSIDIISFDAYSFLEKVALYPHDIKKFMHRGGLLAWGIVPTGSPELVAKETAESLARRFGDGIARFVAKGVPESELCECAIITPSCGMGTLPIPTAERVLALLAELGMKMRESAM